MPDDTKTVNVRALRDHLSDYLHRAEQGESFVVVSRDRPVAQLGPAPEQPPVEGRRSLFGLLKDQIWIADDFDEMPAETLDAMLDTEGEEF
jgi:prevent-host-death family protein